jgi:hypothetical protein
MPEASHRIDHQLERAVDDRASVLWVGVLFKLG